MTPEEVRQRVGALRASGRPTAMGPSYDDENAHIEEKRIWGEVLVAIAKGAPNADALAREALETSHIDFQRWYA